MDEKIRVLVTDDERPIREGCHRVLTGKGYAVLLAENGQMALEVLEKEPVDILLLDLKMPVLGGEEVLEIVRTRHPQLPVIIITGHGTVDTAVECMKKGAYDFITKPFQLDPFLIVVQRAADKRRLEEKARLFEEERGKNLYDLALEKVQGHHHCPLHGKRRHGDQPETGSRPSQPRSHAASGDLQENGTALPCRRDSERRHLFSRPLKGSSPETLRKRRPRSRRSRPGKPCSAPSPLPSWGRKPRWWERSRFWKISPTSSNWTR